MRPTSRTKKRTRAAGFDARCAGSESTTGSLPDERAMISSKSSVGASIVSCTPLVSASAATRVSRGGGGGIDSDECTHVMRSHPSTSSIVKNHWSLSWNSS